MTVVQEMGISFAGCMMSSFELYTGSTFSEHLHLSCCDMHATLLTKFC